MQQDWKERKLDPIFLLDSGLLFEINRQFLHPVGLALTVRKGNNGQLEIGIKDGRLTPDEMIFTPETYEAGCAKIKEFLENFGYEQMRKRENKLGWGVQSNYLPEAKRFRKKRD